MREGARQSSWRVGFHLEAARRVPLVKESSQKIYQLFLNYLYSNDFVGADMARKYLQMGYTRARRYANYKGGKKYDQTKEYTQLERGTDELEKAKAAANSNAHILRY